MMHTPFPRGPRASSYAPDGVGRRSAGFKLADSQQLPYFPVGFNGAVGRPRAFLIHPRHVGTPAALGLVATASKQWVNPALDGGAAAAMTPESVNKTAGPRPLVAAGAAPPRAQPISRAPRPVPGQSLTPAAGPRPLVTAGAAPPGAQPISRAPRPVAGQSLTPAAGPRPLVAARAAPPRGQPVSRAPRPVPGQVPRPAFAGKAYAAGRGRPPAAPAASLHKISPAPVSVKPAAAQAATTPIERPLSPGAAGAGLHSLPQPFQKAQRPVNTQGMKRIGKAMNTRAPVGKINVFHRDGPRRSEAQKVKKLEHSNELCYPFIKFGRCWDLQRKRCPNIHDRSKISVCHRFLGGKCEEKYCPLAHELKPDQMPDCLHFVKGCRCIRDNCPYRHVKFAWGAECCGEFAKGYCPRGRECRQPHKLPEKKRKLAPADTGALAQEGSARKQPRLGNDATTSSSQPRHSSGHGTPRSQPGESGLHQVDAVPPGGGAGSVYGCEPLHREKGGKEVEEDSSATEEEDDDWDDEEFLPKFESRPGQDDEEDW